MKINKLIPFFLIAMAIVSCKEDKNKTETKAEEEVKTSTAEAVKFNVDTEHSTITWKGSKKVGESHNGTLQLSEGSLALEGDKLKGGSFVIDMNSIKNIDIEDAVDNKKLIGHLHSPDFFDVANHPTAKFEITEVIEEVGMDLIKGNLTIKGITKNIQVPATTTVADDGATFKSMTFTIDRTEWDIKYSSGKFFDNLKDKVINDEIEFTIDIKAKK